MVMRAHTRIFFAPWIWRASILAGLTESVDFEAVPFDPKTRAGSLPNDHLVQLAIVEIADRATLAANEMVMVATVGELVADGTIFELQAAEDADLLQELCGT